MIKLLRRLSRSLLWFLILAGILLLWVFTARAQGQGYTIVDLGPGQAYAVSTNGQVVGRAMTTNGYLHAVLWLNNGSVRKDLGSLGSNSVAYGISPNALHIVGSADIAGFQHAVRWTNGVLQDLHGLVSPFITGSSCAPAVNNSGQATGWYDRGVDDSHLFILNSNGERIDPGNLPGMTQSQGWAISETGHVAGVSLGYPNIFGWKIRGILWDGFTMHDLGAFDDNESEAYGVSDDQVVGCSTANPNQTGHLFRRSSDGPMQDLGFLGEGSVGLSVNKKKQIVGASSYGILGTRALLYSNGLWDLNDLIDPASGWILEWANGNNDDGQIVGWGKNPAGRTHAFLLNPIPGFVFRPRLGIKLDEGTIIVTMFGAVGRTYELDYMDALVGPTNIWRPLVSMTLTNSPQDYIDISAIGPSRFYRLVQLP